MENVGENLKFSEKNYDSDFVNARYTAVKLLSRFERSDSYIDKLIEFELRMNKFIPQDKALIVELVNGTIRWRNKLDWILTGFYRGDYQKCLNIVKNALRIAVYQIFFLDRIPIPAAIDESVEIIKRIQGEKIAGVVNGVLRNIVRNINNVRYPERDSDLIYYLSVLYSHPKWIVKRWVERFGEDFTEKLLFANNRRPYVSLRVNTLKASIEDVEAFLHELNLTHYKLPYLDNSILLKSPNTNFAELAIFKNGLITVQDISASLAVELAAPMEGEYVIDLCAAPGGKSFFLAELMHDKGEVLAIEKYSSKIRFIEDGAKRLGIKSISLLNNDASEVKLDRQADLVFLDAPCSGFGTLSKKPDIKWKREIEDIIGLQNLQRSILANAVTLVKPGGRLVYSTCTIEKEENQDNIEWVLKNYPEFEIDPAENYLHKDVCKDGFLQTFSNEHNIDGAFAARLVKKIIT
ncbi:MAG: 16S rRNA (cytosine(967)-C(5))-methyltransferase RsmB [Candidatus Kapabacteria bacterium]|nr:16S rRNA (cytosine(967)-C(5))-methyltransferase RsmB [Candidatus Kapabacteria bacterium]